MQGPGGPYFVHNNNWNDTQNGQYTVNVCAYNNWWLNTNVRRHSDGSVQAYPNIHKDYNDVALSTITSADFEIFQPFSRSFWTR